MAKQKVEVFQLAVSDYKQPNSATQALRELAVKKESIHLSLPVPMSIRFCLYACLPLSLCMHVCLSVCLYLSVSLFWGWGRRVRVNSIFRQQITKLGFTGFK